MPLKIEIASLSTEEKLELIEQLWDSMPEEADIMPEWHKEVLAERRRRMECGEAQSEELSVVMQRLRAKVARDNTPA